MVAVLDFWADSAPLSSDLTSIPIRMAGTSPAVVRTEYLPPTYFGIGKTSKSSFKAFLYRIPSLFSVMIVMWFLQFFPNHFLAPLWIRSKIVVVSSVFPVLDTRRNSVFFLFSGSSNDAMRFGSMLSTKWIRGLVV